MNAQTHRFEVVWKGSWYRLGSFADHNRAGIKSGEPYLLFDKQCREHRAPRDEVHIPATPLTWR